MSNYFNPLSMLAAIDIYMKLTQLGPILCDPIECSPSGSSVHRIFQARKLEWVAISFSRASSQSRDQTQVSHIAGRLFTIWATRESLRTTIWPSNSTTGHISWENKTTIQKDTCTPVFITALFIIARTWKQPKCPSTEEWETLSTIAFKSWTSWHRLPKVIYLEDQDTRWGD